MPRMRSTSFLIRWLVPLTLLFGVACQPKDLVTDVLLAIPSPPVALSRVLVTASGPDVPQRTVGLTRTEDLWVGILGDMPVGVDRSFLAQAYDAGGALRFRGETRGVETVADQATLVTIKLRDVTQPIPLPPRIVRLNPPSSQIDPGQVVELGVTASDPQGSALTFAWTRSAGTLGRQQDDATSSRITWTAPTCAASPPIPIEVRFTITNAYGLSVAQAFTVIVSRLPSCSPECSTPITLDPSRAQHNITLSQNRLSAQTAPDSTNDTVFTTMDRSAGQWYFEARIDQGGDGYTAIGVAAVTHPADFFSLEVGPGDAGPGCGYGGRGWLRCHEHAVSSFGAPLHAGDVVGVAFDLDARVAYFRVNGRWLPGQDPEAGTGGLPLGFDERIPQYSPAITLATGDTLSVNLAGPFMAQPPRGFSPYDTCGGR